ncbi:MAG: TRAP transporter substrate-binding protein [Deltaproteobacteria bacterium]|nr:TRAP transporter substrate-binding protein [Deltaproteobacteria bacterium]
MELKFANYFPPPARHSQICVDFLAELEQRTGGKVKGKYFAGGSLLKAPAMYQGVTTGIADIGLSHVEYTPGRMPVTEAVGLPLGYPSGWVANQVANDFYHKFRPKEWKDVEVLWMHTSTPNVMITKKPVRTLEDLKGMTIRAPGTVGDTVKALGATAAPTPVMEVYDAMSKGVIDGVNIPFETLKTFRFAEVAKFTTSSWQVGNLYPFYVIMNKNSYKKLTGEIKKAFDRLVGEYKERCALMWNQIDFEGRDFAIQQKVEFIDLTPDQVTRWKEAAKPVIEAYVKKMAGSGFSEAEVRGWIKFLGERIDYWTARQIALRIKSPTGPKEMRP